MEMQSRIAKAMLKKNNKVVQFTLPNFKTCYKVTVYRQCEFDEWIEKSIIGSEQGLKQSQRNI